MKEEKNKKQISKLLAICNERGGFCHNAYDYANLSTKLNFSCEKGHSWVCVAQSVLNGRWCPVCAGVAKRTLDDVLAIVISNCGVLLSTEYKNNYTKLDVACKNNHTFKITPSALFQGHWCRQCAIFGEKLDRRLYTIGDIRHICTVRNGKYLGGELDSHQINTSHYGYYQCFDGHEWRSQYDSIVRGHWCPICRESNIDAMKIISDRKMRP